MKNILTTIKNKIIYNIYWLYYSLMLSLDVIAADKPEEKYLNKERYRAFKIHAGLRQRYDKKYPYYYHLAMVVSFVERFKHLLSHEDYVKAFLAALGHDWIEDCNLTYNDVKDLYGEEIADIIFACTELRGKNRAERHGPEYIKGLQESRLGTFVKLCDICANMTMGTRTQSSMLFKYRKEYPKKIKANLYREEFKEIFDYIEANLLK